LLVCLNFAEASASVLQGYRKVAVRQKSLLQGCRNVAEASASVLQGCEKVAVRKKSLLQGCRKIAEASASVLQGCNLINLIFIELDWALAQLINQILIELGFSPI
jgi:hypothetical protein